MDRGVYQLACRVVAVDAVELVVRAFSIDMDARVWSVTEWALARRGVAISLG